MKEVFKFFAVVAMIVHIGLFYAWGLEEALTPLLGKDHWLMYCLIYGTTQALWHWGSPYAEIK
jgi:hypothetical protein